MGRGQAEACTVAEKGAGLGAVGISSWLPQPRLLIVRVWIPWECSVLTVMGNTGVLLGCLVLGLMHLSALGQQTGLQKGSTVETPGSQTWSPWLQHFAKGAGGPSPGTATALLLGPGSRGDMPDEEPAHPNITSKKVPGLGWSAGNLTLDKNTITSLLIKGSSDGSTAVSTKSDSVFKIVDENVTTDKQKGDAGSRTSVLFPGKPSDKIDLDAKQSSLLPDSKTSAHSPQRPAPQVQDTNLLLEEEELLVAAPLPTAHPRTGELYTGINASATPGGTHNLTKAGNGTLQHSMDSRTDRITDTRVLKGAVQQHKEGSVVQGSDGRQYRLKPGPPGPIGPAGKPVSDHPSICLSRSRISNEIFIKPWLA
ncbi:UNVERIFIED_CONTAM: hypothetical protein FKN15_011024 [Acipenser sinensis]